MADQDYNTETYPKFPESYWRDSINLPEFPSLNEDLKVDAVIVGGGITGLTTAYLLANEGKKVAVLEAGRLLNGTTGHTTAKITAQHGLIYDELIGTIGQSKTRLYYEANIEALNFIKKTISQHDIQCDFSKQDAIIYATTDEYEEKIIREASAYEKISIQGELVTHIPLDLEIKNALIMKDQAQFHPLKYLAKLVDMITEKGGLIFEDTTAVNIETGDEPTVLTINEAKVIAKHVLVCTHFPFYEGLGLYSARMYADRSYALAVKPTKAYPGAMYLSADKPTRSLRSVKINDEDMILVVGEEHKTGQAKDTQKYYGALKNFAQDTFGIESIPYHWSAQDLVTLDKVPYIGEITAEQPNILIATGFRKWGMTNGTAAALLLSDIVLDKKNRFQELFTPTRFYANPSIKNLLVQNANVVGQLLKGKLQITNTDLDSLANDEGTIIRIKGERKGAYKDESGELHIVDTTCTHIGCEVEWNNSERTWDCPCHGSRFSYEGEVINGPAEKPLQKYDYKMLDNLTSEDSGY